MKTTKNTYIYVKFIWFLCHKAINVKIVVTEVMKHFEKGMMGRYAAWSKAN